MVLLLKSRAKEKSYIRVLPSLDYDSTFHLVFDLFLFHPHMDREVELMVYELLYDTGLKSIDGLTPEELMDLVLYLSKYKTRYPALTFDEDEEKLSYLLLAAIKREEVIMHIDGEEVRNLQAEISLNDDSTIGFFNRAKLDSIGFTTI